MTNIIKRKHLLSLRSGKEVWPDLVNTPLSKRNCPPGQHCTKGYKKLSNFGKQSREQKILKRYYYMGERKFSNIYKEAYAKSGNTKDNLSAILESRLIAVVYHGRLASTIFSAKQLISHKHILVNGKVINLSGYRVKPGDLVQVRSRVRDHQDVVNATEHGVRRVPDYLQLDINARSVKVLRMPNFEEFPLAGHVEIDRVIEYYF